jgi:phytoene desaturase
MRIVVIGCGLGGLSTAIRLRAAGHDVTVIDKQNQPGGIAQVYHQDGFTFDAGPPVITAPWLIQELFDLTGRRTNDYVTLAPLEPFYTIRFEDGSVFRFSGLAEPLARELRKFSTDDIRGAVRLRAIATRLFESAFPLAQRPLARATDASPALIALLRDRATRPVASLVNAHITDARLRRVFAIHPSFAGAEPAHTPGVFTALQALEQRWGVWYPMGGMGALVRALARLLVESGAVLRLGQEATEIVIDPSTRRATGVRVALADVTGPASGAASTEVLPADAVVTNADVASTYLHLVPAAVRTAETDHRVLGRTYARSLFILCFGTDRQYPGLSHYEILMGERHGSLGDDPAARAHLGDDFSLHLHRATATDPSLAPAGCDSWYVMATVPNLSSGTDWASAARPLRDAIVRYLEDRYLPGLSRHIVAERCIDPRYFRDAVNAHLGSAYSAALMRGQVGWRRPHNQSPDVANLYCVGAGTHPGAGVPGVLCSGRIAAQLIGPA